MLLEVEHLRVAFRLGEGRISVPVRDVSFEIPENGRVALVGESGCGKSVTSLAIGGLVERAGSAGTVTGRPRVAGPVPAGGRRRGPGDGGCGVERPRSPAPG